MNRHVTHRRPPRRWRPLRPRLIALLAALAVPLLGACGSTAEAGRRAPFAQVRIENDNPRIVQVYAVRSGNRIRLGTVNGVSSETFEIRQHMLEAGGELRVLVEALGSRNRYYSDPILVSEGDLIELTVSGLVR